ncbi:MAG: polyphosphate kinase 1 [Bdellovibrionota bacterium]
MSHPQSVNPYLNREMGLLKFNERVLYQALNKRTPLLEKVNFINIFHSNMDEFFMKRLAGLKKLHEARLQSYSLDGLTPKEQIDQIRVKILELNKQVNAFVDKDLKNDLEANGVHLLRWRNLNAKEKAWVTDLFKNKIFPVLTPMAVDQAHPFPHISNLSTSIAVSLKHPQEEELLFTRIKIPPIFPMWVRLEPRQNERDFRFISMIDIIIQHLEELFPNMEIKNMMTFRVTRSIDIKDYRDEDAEDLLELIVEEVRQRKYTEIVRLEHGNNPDPWLLKFLLEELELKEEDVYPYPGRLEFKDLKNIYKQNIQELKYPLWSPVAPTQLADNGQNIFNAIKQNDILLHHPYESFTNSVERLVVTAANDPNVMAIKMTLYRTAEDSALVEALIKAAETGKQVVCLIELQARMDEERNIYLAQTLEEAGVHVVYGIAGLKTHAKIVLIVRKEQEDFKVYAHIGTGNYNPVTARLYTDVGLLTCNTDITKDLTDLFHYLTGRSLKTQYNKILVAPVTLKDSFLQMIAAEVENQKSGKPAEIIAKMNSLEDKDIIKALYDASQEGVKIQLIVRGFSCLRPQQKDLSKNIYVTSILGRFLEHSRIFYFRNGEEDQVQGKYFIGSADWMSRNLNNRVEVVTPIDDRNAKIKLHELLEVYLQDQVSVWDMDSSGNYNLRSDKNDLLEGSQELLMKQALLKYQSYVQNRIGTSL